MIGLIATIVIFPAVGFAARRLVGTANSFLLGAGITGAWLFCAGIVHIPFALAAVLLLLATVASLVATRSSMWSDIRQDYPALPTIIAVIAAAWLLLVTTIVPLQDYDGRTFWLLKAKAVAHEGTVDGPFFTGSTVSPRNQYPLLLPMDCALVMRISGSLDERHVRWLYACLPIAFALEIRRRFRGWFSPSIAAWCAAVLMSIPQVLVRQDGGASSAYADIAMGAFAGCAAFEIIDRTSPARFALWLVFLTLTKSEGVPLALLLLAIAAFAWRRGAEIAAGPLSAAVALLLWWRTRVPQSDERDFVHIVLQLPNHWKRYGASLLEFARQPFVINNWGLLLVAFAGALIILIVRREWRPVALVASMMVPMIALYAAVFAVTDWAPIELTYLAPRLLTHLLGPMLFLVATAAHRLSGANP